MERDEGAFSASLAVVSRAEMRICAIMDVIQDLDMTLAVLTQTEANLQQLQTKLSSAAEQAHGIQSTASRSPSALSIQRRLAVVAQERRAVIREREEAVRHWQKLEDLCSLHKEDSLSGSFRSNTLASGWGSGGNADGSASEYSVAADDQSVIDDVELSVEIQQEQEEDPSTEDPESLVSSAAPSPRGNAVVVIATVDRNPDQLPALLRSLSPDPLPVHLEDPDKGSVDHSGAIRVSPPIPVLLDDLEKGKVPFVGVSSDPTDLEAISQTRGSSGVQDASTFTEDGVQVSTSRLITGVDAAVQVCVSDFEEVRAVADEVVQVDALDNEKDRSQTKGNTEISACVVRNAKAENNEAQSTVIVVSDSPVLHIEDENDMETEGTASSSESETLHSGAKEPHPESSQVGSVENGALLAIEPTQISAQSAYILLEEGLPVLSPASEGNTPIIVSIFAEDRSRSSSEVSSCESAEECGTFLVEESNGATAEHASSVKLPACESPRDVNVRLLLTDEQWEEAVLYGGLMLPSFIQPAEAPAHILAGWRRPLMDLYKEEILKSNVSAMSLKKFRELLEKSEGDHADASNMDTARTTLSAAALQASRSSWQSWRQNLDGS
eukprot:ANDGO_06768.mRNA.1 hypothetical protein